MSNEEEPMLPPLYGATEAAPPAPPAKKSWGSTVAAVLVVAALVAAVGSAVDYPRQLQTSSGPPTTSRLAAMLGFAEIESDVENYCSDEYLDLGMCMVDNDCDTTFEDQANRAPLFDFESPAEGRRQLKKAKCPDFYLRGCFDISLLAIRCRACEDELYEAFYCTVEFNLLTEEGLNCDCRSSPGACSRQSYPGGKCLEAEDPSPMPSVGPTEPTAEPSFKPTKAPHNRKSDGAAAVGLGLATVAAPLMALF